MAKIIQIRKKDGSIVPFEPLKLEKSLENALISSRHKNPKIAKKLAAQVIDNLEKHIPKGVLPTVKDIQDIILEVLKKIKLAEVAKAFVQHRKVHKEAVGFRTVYGVRDDLGMSTNAIIVLAKRYLLKNEQGTIIETPARLFRRVAKTMAAVEAIYSKSVKKSEEEFYDILSTLQFLPNTPTLMNAGAPLGQLSACFAPEQVIICKEGPKHIKDIRVGDEVLTHLNRYRKVTDIFTRDSDHICAVKAWKLPNQTLRVTDEHPILAIKNGAALEPRWIRMRDLQPGDYVALAHPEQTIDVDRITAMSVLNDPSYVEIDGFVRRKNNDARNRSGPVSRQVVPIKNTIVVDENLMRLFGYYLSEGCTDGDCVRFTFSCKEEAYAREIIATMRDTFGVSSIIEHTNNPTRKWISVRFHSKILAAFFLKLFGTGFSKKIIPAWILQLPQHKQKALLCGMFREDGTFYAKAKGTSWGARLVMCNQQLVYAAWQMLMRCGCFSALHELSMPKLGTTQPYQVTISGSAGTQLTSEFFQFQVPQAATAWKRHIVVNGTIFTPIESIIREPYSGKVYNLEVEEDHSYVANMVAVHNCFVLPVEDDLRLIFHQLENAMLIHQSGGGTGFSFGRLRPRGDRVRSTQGVASGPVSFMTIYDKATEVIKQGGKRRGANMGILPIDHPDIEEFINAKRKPGMLENFNVSVTVTDKFMNAVAKDQEFELLNPRNKQPMKKIKAKELWNQMVMAAWECGDPGVVFIDEINRRQPTPQVGLIESTNPCGEVPLLPYEPCNLGSINLARLVKNGKLQWDRLKHMTRVATHFLDNVIDANKWQLPEIEQVAKANRKIGLGVMGWAECLARCGIKYDSDRAIQFAEKVAKFIQDESRKKSVELGQERGSFPNLQRSTYAKKYKVLRNATCTTIAPTGTISIIANATSGIEPFFAISFVREVMGGIKLLETNTYFEQLAKERGFYSKQLMAKIAKQGSIQKIAGIPSDVKRVFVTSFDIKPEWHVKHQAAWQKFSDNAVSKTVNLPPNALPKDVDRIYQLAHRLKCKGITIFRYGSKKEQVLKFAGKAPAQEHVTVEEEFAGGCPSEVCPF